MKRIRYINRENMPPRFGLTAFILWWLFLERVQAPGWVYGIAFTLLGIVTIVEIIRYIWGEAVDILKEDEKQL